VDEGQRVAACLNLFTWKSILIPGYWKRSDHSLSNFIDFGETNQMTHLLLSMNLPLAADPNEDMLGIIIFFFDFTLFCLIGFAIFNRIANAKAAKLWPKLASVIDGTFHKGIGLTAPYIAGNYHGLPVRAWVFVTARSRWNFIYYFQIRAALDTRGRDWTLRYNNRSGEKQGWEIHTKDPALQQRLPQAGLLGMIPGWDTETSLSYNGRKGTLLYSHHMYTREALPSPEVFEMELGLLRKVANLNRQVNDGTAI
jgi:hypothetical protein